jgi:hypothetical protein
MPEDLDDILIDNYDPMLPGEARAYVVIDGIEFEVGMDSEIIRQVGTQPIENAAYFPEVRPDRPTGGSVDVEGGNTIDDFVEWL